MANKTVIIDFKAGDTTLINHLKELDKVSKSLTSTQKQIINADNKSVQSKTKHRAAVKKLYIDLKLAGRGFKDVGYNTKQFSKALKGNKIAIAQVQAQTKKYIQSLKKVDTQSKKSSQRTRILGGTFAVMRSKMLLFNFAMGLGIRQLGKFGSAASKVESMSIAFGTLSGGTELASDALDKLEMATNDTMSQFDLFQQANNAMILGVSKNSDEMAEMFDIAQRLGRALGRDTASSVESLVTGIGRQSRLMLDNIGIIVKSEEAYESYANKLGVTTDELSDAEKKQAFLEATMASARRKVADLGDEVLTNQDAYDKLSASADNLTAALGTRLQPLLTTLASAFTTIADEASETMRVTAILKTDYASLSTHEERREHLLAQIIKQEKSLAKITKGGSADFRTHAMLTKAIAENKMLLHFVNKNVAKSQERAVELTKKEAEEQKKLIKAEKDRLDKLAQAEIDRKAKIKDREWRDKEQIKRKKAHNDFIDNLEKDRQAARETIFEDDLAFNLKQLDDQATQFRALKLNAEEEAQITKWLGDQKALLKKEAIDKQEKIDKEARDKIKDARAIVLEDNVEFQLAELEIQREQYEQLLTSKEDQLALEEWFKDQKSEIAMKNLEDNIHGFKAAEDAYDTFVDSMLDKDMTMMQTQEAMWNAFKESMFKFLAEILKEKIKHLIAESIIKKSANKATEVEAAKSGAKIYTAYAPAAKTALLATAGGVAIPAAIGAEAVGAVVDSFQIARDGGLIGGRRHSQGGTLIEAEQGEFIMSRNAVESIGIDNLASMNQGGGVGVTINIQGNMIGNESFVRDTLIPEISKTVNEGLA